MIDLFTSIPVRAEGVTGSYVQTQIQIYARDLLTGLLHNSGSDQLALFVLRGRPIGLYGLAGRSWENIASDDWEDVRASASGDLHERARRF